ncbi:MAG: aldehyde ferredoxin oxidoreductase N-terminal domain-containing protein [Thermodesulfobacteriota bacterium]|nr:aldehyde ferredoxin oxidoreductase N-terminal domain-containing protein [Thermodesulfobacteriota bacterium]
MMYGYGGNILYIDLTDGNISKEPLDPTMAKSFLGGSGFSQRLAYDNIIPESCPFLPENAIIIGVGLFSGTIVPGSAELSITYKAPLNGGIVTSNGGGSFPLMLKSSGYDAVVIRGRAKKPVYLKIFNDDIEIHDAENLWGMDNYDTTDALRRMHEPCSIIPISAAGENLVRISMSFIDKGGTIGSGGLPALMGSKNLKAIVACLGDREIEIADPVRLMKRVDKINERVFKYFHRQSLIEGGTFSMTKGWLGAMTSMMAGVDIEDWDKLHRSVRKGLACPSCVMGDKDLVRIREGDYACSRIYTTDFMAEWDSSGSTDTDKYNRAIYRKDFMNREGIDRMSHSQIMELLASLYKDGIINSEEIGGLELDGQPPDYVDYDTALDLLYMISHRQGIGNELAEGGVRLAEKIGKCAKDYLVHIKGFPQFIDPRVDTFHIMTFSQMVFPGRTHYAPGGLGLYGMGRSIDEHIKHARRIGMTEEDISRIFESSTYNVGRLTKHTHNWYSLFNCLGQCHRLYIHRFHGMEGFIDMYSAITGEETTSAELLRGAERAWNIYRILNSREGFSRKDDSAPKQWFGSDKSDGTEVGGTMMDYFSNPITIEDTKRALDEYYDECGWDKKEGSPTLRKLTELRLDKL